MVRRSGCDRRRIGLQADHLGREREARGPRRLMRRGLIDAAAQCAYLNSIATAQITVSAGPPSSTGVSRAFQSVHA